MTDVWGNIPKSQDNAQTIDEAIAAAIAAHDADSEAHLGSGAVLEDHRSNETLDHPAGSVLADKQTLTEVDVYCDFPSTSGWTPTGDYDIGFYPGIRLGSAYPSSNGTRLLSQESFGNYMFNLAKDFLFEWAGTIFDGTTATFFIGVTDVSYPASGDDVFGFKCVNGAMRGIFGKGATFYQTDVYGGDLSEPHVYRVQYNATEKIIYFYVDGVLLGSSDLSSLSGSSTCDFRLSLKESAENYVTVFIYYLRASRQT